MPVRPNPMQAALAAGEPRIGTWLMMVWNPSVMTLMKSVGLDFVRVDLEHTPISLESVAALAAVGRALDLPVLARPPSSDRDWITRLLDAGVWGLHVPQVETAEQAEQIVRAARHAPLGARGTFEPGPQNDYTEPSEPTGSLAFLNEQVHITVMLETVEAFRNIEEIAAVPGIDALSMGPADLAQDLGVYDTPDEASAVEPYKTQLLEVAARHGKQVEMGAWSPEEAEYWIGRGVQVITYLTDTTVLRAGFGGAMRRFRPAAGAR